MLPLTYAELFAGAGGMSIGLEAAGWTCVAHAEIEPHARAVLRKVWPEVRLDGDVSQLNGADYKGITMLTGGSPCQDLSIAGKRGGMTEGSGTRSSLYFEQIRIWKESQAPLLLWENVVGAYSSNGGKDFGAVLSAIVGAAVPVPADGWRGAGVASGPTGVAAWRTLDAQYFGVPQRRRRIFVLGVRGGVLDPAEVLALAESLSGHLEAGEKAGEGFAPDAGRGVTGKGVIPTGFSTTGSVGYVHDVMPSLPHLTGLNCPGAQMMGVLDKEPLGVNCLTPWDNQSKRVFASDGVFPSLQAAEKSGQQQPAVVAFNWQSGGDVRLEPRTEQANTLQANQTQAVVLRNREGKPGGGKGPLLSAERSLTLGTTNDQVVFTMDKQSAHPESTEVSPTLKTDLAHQMGPVVSVFTKPHLVHPPLMTDHFSKHSGRNQHVAELAEIISVLGVPRRLTPVECERLMGWSPDGHTAHGIDEKGREYALADTPRYKLCGNGIASPVAQWIGWRIRTELERRA